MDTKASEIEASADIRLAITWLLRLPFNYKHQVLEALDRAILELRSDVVSDVLWPMEDDRDFLRRVVAQGPYRVSVVDLGLSDYADLVLLRGSDEKTPSDPLTPTDD